MFFNNPLLFGEETLNHIHINAGRWLDFIMVAFTQLGNEMFYILLIPFLFWCVNKRFAVIIGLSFLFSAAINDIVKFIFINPRPDATKLLPEIAKLNMMYCPPSSPGFPSGHAQNAVMFWGTMSYLLRHRLFTLFAIFLILAISYSRLYLGVHFLGDVAGGIIIGTVLLLCTIICIPYMNAIWNIRMLVAITIFTIIPFVLSLVLNGNEIAKSLGVLSGFLIGLIMYNNKTEEFRFSLLTALLKYFIGIAILLILKEGLKLILLSTPLFDFLRYWIIGLWVSYGAPTLFKKIPYLSKNSM